MAKLVLMCCILSFICGMFLTVLVEKERSRSCTVTYSHGDRVHVLIGSR